MSAEVMTPKNRKSGVSRLTDVIVGKEATGSPANLSGGAARVDREAASPEEEKKVENTATAQAARGIPEESKDPQPNGLV